MDISKNGWRNFLQTLLFNTIIAVFLTGINFGYGFTSNLIFSQCIGISIFLCIHGALRIFTPATSLPQVLTIAVALLPGVTFGTIIGAVANGISPTAFFNDNTNLFVRVISFSLFFGAAISFIFVSRERIAEEKIKNLDMEKRALESELRLVQAQMEPHFLFNTLSNILALMGNNPDKARLMLESLTSFLRASLTTAREAEITVAQEMEIVGRYLEIFTIRMGERLQYRIDIPEAILQYRLPPLLLQPLVENAIKHGLEPQIKGGEICMSGKIQDGWLRLEVSDTGMGISENSSGLGIGLDNIRKRLELAYAGQARLRIEENQPSGLKAIIEVPYAG